MNITKSICFDCQYMNPKFLNGSKFLADCIDGFLPTNETLHCSAYLPKAGAENNKVRLTQ